MPLCRFDARVPQNNQDLPNNRCRSRKSYPGGFASWLR